jgi:hypothetical protein
MEGSKGKIEWNDRMEGWNERIERYKLDGSNAPNLQIGQVKRSTCCESHGRLHGQSMEDCMPCMEDPRTTFLEYSLTIEGPL